MQKPWIYSLVGGLLILGSSAISGIYVSRLEASASNLDEEISNLQIDLSQASRANETANIHSDLGYIQRAVIKYSVFFQDKEIQATWDHIHAASLYTVILKLRSASGLEVNDDEVESLKELRGQVEAGDRKAYQKLQAISAELSEKSGIYQGDLVVKIADEINKKVSISNKIAWSRETAIFAQLLGLFILLIKELPKYQQETHNKLSKRDAEKPGAPS